MSKRKNRVPQWGVRRVRPLDPPMLFVKQYPAQQLQEETSGNLPFSTLPKWKLGLSDRNTSQRYSVCYLCTLKNYCESSNAMDTSHKSIFMNNYFNTTLNDNDMSTPTNNISSISSRDHFNLTNKTSVDELPLWQKVMDYRYVNKMYTVSC